MSEEQLLVTLGVQDKGANKQIQALNKEIRYLDKEFKTTSRGSKEFEKTQEGLSTKLTTLEKKYDIQKLKIEAYNKQLKESKEKVETKKAELEKLKNAEGDNTKAIEKAEKQLETYQNKMRTATQNINLAEIELKNLKQDIDSTNEALKNKSLDEYKAKMQELSKGLDNAGNKIDKVGKGITTLGKGASVASAGIVAAGTAGVASYKEVKVGLDNVIKATGATDEAAKGLETTYKNIASNSGDDFGVIGSTLGEVNTRFGFLDKKAEECTKTFLEFARINNTDATKSVQLVSRAMGDAGIKADDYKLILDQLTVAAQASGISIDKLTENLTKYGAPMRALGFDTKESIAIFASWEKAGVNTEIAFSGMKKAISNWSSAGKDARKEFKKTLEEIGKCPDIASATTKAIEVFGQKAGPDLADAIKGVRFEYSDFLNVIEKSEGTVSKTFNQITDGTEDAAIAMNNAKLASAELGKTIMTNATPFLKELSKEVKKASEWFQGLDETTKNNIVKTAAYTATVGPALLMVGKFTSGVGNLVTGTGKGVKKIIEFTTSTKKIKDASEIAEKGVGLLTGGMKLLNPTTLAVGASVAVLAAGVKLYNTHSELMNKNILYTTDEMSELEKAVAKFTGVNAKSKDELIQMNLIYKDFSGNISKEFKDKVVEITNKVHEFNMKLTEINVDGIITKEESQAFESRVDEMCDSAINAIKSKQEESNSAMKEFFLRDNVLSDNEKLVLESLDRISKTNIDEVTKLKNEIFEIERKALDEKGALNEEEINLIKEKRDRIAQIELQSIGKTQEEILYAQNEFQNRLNNISLEDASKLMVEKAKLRDDEYVKIKSSYDTKITMLKESLKQANDIERTAIQEQIDSLTSERDSKLKINDDLYNGYLKTIGEKSPQIVEEINKYNGEILEGEDHKSQEMLAKLQSQYENMNMITESGNYLMLNKNTGALDALSVTVDEKTGDITGIYEDFNHNVGGYTSDISDKVKKMGEEHKLSASKVKEALNDMSKSSIDSAGNILNANGEIVWSLKDVKNNADGTREGVLNLNGTPIKIQSDASGAIRNLDEIRNKVNEIPGTKQITITTVLKSVAKGALGMPWLKFAKGTNNAPSGTHIVGEEGFEIATKGNKANLVGLSGPEFRTFKGGEKIIPHNRSVNMLKNVMTTGGYFSPNSIQSRELINNVTNNYNNSVYSNISNTNNSGQEFNINSVNQAVNLIAEALISKINNANVNLNADLNSLAGQLTPGIKSNITREQQSKNLVIGKVR